LLGKALGGGMPMGAVVTSHAMMNTLTHNPVLGHLTTFGGHPVCSAAGLAAMEILEEENLIAQVADKEQLFHQLLVHPAIQAVRSVGLLMAVELKDNQIVLKVLEKSLNNGLFSDWFLFADNCLRIAPPLTITQNEIREACAILLACLEEITNNSV
jgi:acetylornithine/succinyldiaminopimelate/putrescine aminotransferase